MPLVDLPPSAAGAAAEAFHSETGRRRQPFHRSGTKAPHRRRHCQQQFSSRACRWCRMH